MFSPLSFLHLEYRSGKSSVFCVGGYGRKEFAVLMSKSIPNLNFYGDPQQSFPFYTYDENGRQPPGEHYRLGVGTIPGALSGTTLSASGTSFIMSTVCSITRHIGSGIRRTSSGICRAYRTHQISGSLPKRGSGWERFTSDYEEVEEYPLRFVETPDTPLDWRVEKMRLSKDKTGIKYNDFLTLDGIPAKAFEYRLGNRSALEWVIDQYRVKTDKRSGIVNDPNRRNDEEYIVRLIGKVIAVSLETVKIVEGLPELGIAD